MRQPPKKSKQKQALDALRAVIFPEDPDPKHPALVESSPEHGMQFVSPTKQAGLATQILKMLNELDSLGGDTSLYKEYRILRKLHEQLSQVQGTDLQDPLIQFAHIVGPTLDAALRSYEEVFYPTKEIRNVEDLQNALLQQPGKDNKGNEVINAILQGKTILMTNFEYDNKRTLDILGETLFQCGLTFGQSENRKTFTITPTRPSVKQDPSLLTFSHGKQYILDRLKEFPKTYATLETRYQEAGTEKSKLEFDAPSRGELEYLGPQLAKLIEKVLKKPINPKEQELLDKLDNYREQGIETSFSKNMSVIKNVIIKPWKNERVKTDLTMVATILRVIYNFEHPKPGRSKSKP